jgi:hypothetical protein
MLFARSSSSLALLLALALAPPVSRAEDAPPQPAAPPPAEPATVLSSYAELNYNRPRDPANAVVDLRRFVIGLEHRFDAQTKAGAELEVEHAVSSASDPGEVEVEQAWIERQLGSTWAVRGGLFLMPAGLLNENHEPTAYHGVERNFVETAIIPTTWREAGVQAVASLASGITVQGGITTSFDLTKWDATSPEGQESPLGAVHQEAALARAHDFGGHLAVNYRGLPGLLVGASAFAGGGTQGQPGYARSTIVLWDAHARWNPGRLDLSALYARGTISNTKALNTPLVGNPYLIPAAFDGWYAQAAYRVWSRDALALTPFTRYERYNTGSSYADLGPGLTPSALETQGVLTLGIDFDIAAGVVVKADVQKFEHGRELDRLDLGLGWSL